MTKNVIPQRVQTSNALFEALFKRHSNADSQTLKRLFNESISISAAMMHIQLLQQSMKHARILADVLNIDNADVENLLAEASDHFWTALGNMEREEVKRGDGGIAVVMASYIAAKGLDKSEEAMRILILMLSENGVRVAPRDETELAGPGQKHGSKNMFDTLLKWLRSLKI